LSVSRSFRFRLFFSFMAGGSEAGVGMLLISRVLSLDGEFVRSVVGWLDRLMAPID